MANGVFNVSKGKAAELTQNVVDDEPTAASILRLVLLEGTITDDALRILTDWAAIKASALSEATFTNYTAKGKAISNPTVTVVHAPSHRVDCDFPDQTWTAAGNGVNNTLTRACVLYDVDGAQTDANIIPLTFHDFSVVTDGSDLTAQVNSQGFFSAG